MEVLNTKRCLFCDSLVQVKHKGGSEWYMNCLCSPSGSYGLKDDSYEPFRMLSYTEKRAEFPIISAYIREQSDCEEKVIVSFDERAAILQSPLIPLTAEEKGLKLLRYLHRHASGPDEPVVISQFSQCANLTYSMNLQELVYIVEKLKEEGLIERIGSTFRLTEKGWLEAESSASGKAYKPCFVLLPHGEEEMAQQWTENVFPRLLQLGYAPKLLSQGGPRSVADKPVQETMQQVLKCRLMIADISDPEAETWMYAGYALGNDIPVAWTCRSSATGTQPPGVRPIVWENAEQLADQLQFSIGREAVTSDQPN
ncbi:MarR family transcriptional regulator [Paenibacillus rhizovicinus]|uniref:MarR family transcriptional regulator n=1 Tax=Paenibacillus rhizovicinus TaxID=2704463 RepID=A0A6C0P849_9BACL|nr:MarR family transcriptional regulator [Paenibacillus rhizovicinus]QHW34586.1 MarR family transcriptional regulator [Paenibacillus rhizovicinus]